MFDVNDVPMDLQVRVGDIIYKMISVKGDQWIESHALSVKELGRLTYRTHDMDMLCHVKVTGRKLVHVLYDNTTVKVRCKINTFDENGYPKEPFGGYVYLEFYKDI